MRLASLCAIVLSAGACCAAKARILTPELLVSAPRPGTATAHPDGGTAIIPVATADAQTGAIAQSLYAVSLAGEGTSSEYRQKIFARNSSAGVFFSKHEVAYLSKNTLYLRDIGSLDEQEIDAVLIRFPTTVANLKVAYRSEEAVTLVFSAEVYDDGDLDNVKKHDESSTMQEWKRAMAFDKVLVRHWDVWLYPHRRSQLFSVDFEYKDGRWQRASGVRNLMKGTKHETPVGPLGDAQDFAVSRDWAAYATPTEGKNLAWHTTLDIKYVPLDGHAEAKTASVEQRGWAGSPSIAPDGKYIVFLQQLKDGFESDRKVLQSYSLHTGKQSEHLSDWDTSPSSVAFSRDGSSLHVLTEIREQVKVFRIAVHHEDGALVLGEPEELMGSGTTTDVADLSNGDLLYTRSTLQHPNDVYVQHQNGTSERLTSFLHESKEHRDLNLGPRPEQFSYRGSDDVEMHGWVIKPPNFDDVARKSGKLPVALLIHGGPESAWTNSWSTRWNPVAFASAGYVVVTIDPSGSTGFGQAMTERILLHWGARPYEDVMKGVRHILKTVPNVDSDRVVAAGASFGGYMINWIQGQDHGTFKGLVTHDGVFDTHSTWYGTEELYFPESEFGGKPWEKNTTYAQSNPAAHAANWKTPHLIIHGGQDFRLDPSQGISAFNVLQRKQVPSRLLFFPDEGHWVQNPLNSVRWHHEIFGWFKKCLDKSFERRGDGVDGGEPHLSSRAESQLVFQ